MGDRSRKRLPASRPLSKRNLPRVDVSAVQQNIWWGLHGDADGLTVKFGEAGGRV